MEPEVGADDAGVGGAVGEDDDEGFGQQRNLGGGCRPRAPPSSVAQPVRPVTDAEHPCLDGGRVDGGGVGAAGCPLGVSTGAQEYIGGAEVDRV